MIYNGARYKYLETLCEMVQQGEDIVLVSADYAAPSLDQFRIDYPERYVSVGIAEQNLIQVACGLAMAGKHAVAYGLAPFPCIRAFDQIRNAACIMNLPITIVAAGVGFAIPEFGATHYNTEDISIMRTLPNMSIVTPTDDTLAEVAARQCVRINAPMYVRFDKYAGGALYKTGQIDFKQGFYSFSFGTNADIGIVACGYDTIKALEVGKKLHSMGKNVCVFDLFQLPFDEAALESQFCSLTSLVTIEEHVLPGGLGSVILEFLSNHQLNMKIKRIGVEFGKAYTHQYGNREYFMDAYGVSTQAIYDMAYTYLIGD